MEAMYDQVRTRALIHIFFMYEYIYIYRILVLTYRHLINKIDDNVTPDILHTNSWCRCLIFPAEEGTHLV